MELENKDNELFENATEPEQQSKALNENPTQESNKNVVNVVETIFKGANLNILAIFLIAYLLIFIVFGTYIGQNQERKISNTFDFVMFGCLFIYFVYEYYKSRRNGKNITNDTLASFIELYDNDLALFSIMLFVVCFYLLLFLLRVPNNEYKPVSVMIIEGGSWFLLATLTIHNCLKYFFDIDVLENLRDNDYSQYLENVMESDILK